MEPQSDQLHNQPAPPASSLDQPPEGLQPISPSQAPSPDPAKPQEHHWQASEYIFHEKPILWYIGLWVIAALLAGVLAYFQQWLSIAVVVVMVLAITVYSRKQPRTLNYDLDVKGVAVQGQVTPYTSFKSFSIHEDMAWHSVDLEPTKRFVPRLTLICENEDIEIIDQIISQHLPRVDHEPEWIDRLARYLRF